jgi:hypothetical protein
MDELDRKPSLMPDKQNIQTIQPYQRLAAYYDTLMDYINYDIWVDDIEAWLHPMSQTRHGWISLVVPVPWLSSLPGVALI